MWETIRPPVKTQSTTWFLSNKPVMRRLLLLAQNRLIAIEIFSESFHLIYIMIEMSLL
jgi:hypothetical protein